VPTPRILEAKTLPASKLPSPTGKIENVSLPRVFPSGSLLFEELLVRMKADMTSFRLPRPIGTTPGRRLKVWAARVCWIPSRAFVEAMLPGGVRSIEFFRRYL
jgi:hypothetical protein